MVTSNHAFDTLMCCVLLPSTAHLLQGVQHCAGGGRCRWWCGGAGLPGAPEQPAAPEPGATQLPVMTLAQFMSAIRV